MDLESHGRHDLSNNLDISRTVGWFTAIYPVFLTLKGVELGEDLRLVAGQLRQVPNGGLGYGLLRYLDPEGGVRLQKAPKAEIIFNYLGQFDDVLMESDWHIAPEPTGLERSVTAKRTHLLEISSYVVGGRLHLGLGYSRAVHRDSTIQGCLADCMDELRRLAISCSTAGASQGVSDSSQAGFTAQARRQALRRRGSKSPVVRLNEQHGVDAQGIPYYYVHPMGGFALVYSNLAKAVKNGPFYGLQSPGIAWDDNEAEWCVESIESLARRYVEAMRAATPHGPYHLGGWSFGATLAFEMAQQLWASDGGVASLALLDMPQWGPSFSAAERAAREREPDDSTILAQLFFGVLRGEEDNFLGPGTDEERIVRLIARTGWFTVVGDHEIAWAKRLANLARQHENALLRYFPAPYPGPIVLFQPTVGLDDAQAAANRDELAALSTEKVEVCPVAATHRTILEPHGIETILHWYAQRFDSARFPVLSR